MLVLNRGRLVSAEQMSRTFGCTNGPRMLSLACSPYVSHLRRRLEPDAAARSRSGVIERQSRGYCVRLPDGAVDVWRFQQLLETGGTASGGDEVRRMTDALALWRGAALADYSEEPWAQPDIIRLEELRSGARERLASARLDRGEAGVLVELEAMVGEDPLARNVGACSPLRSTGRGGRRMRSERCAARAVSSPTNWASTRDPPCARSRPTSSRRRRGWTPSRRKASPGRSGHLGGMGSPSARERLDAEVGADLVERDLEVSLLRQALAQVRLGRSTRALVEGPAGIGKTRLLDELDRHAAGCGMQVLAAHGSPLEQSLATGSFAS